MAKSNDHIDTVDNNYLPWMFASLLIVVMLSLFVPFPLSFFLSLIIVFSLSIFRAHILLKKAGMGGIKGWCKSYSSLQPGRRWGSGGDSFTYKPLTFYCMSCGNRHNKVACPKCGSKAVIAS